MCWGDPLIWNDGEVYVPSFAGSLCAFVMAYPDDYTPHFPERVAKRWRDNPHCFTQTDIQAAEALGARGHANEAADALIGGLPENFRIAMERIDGGWHLLGVDDDAWDQIMWPAVQAAIEAMIDIDGVKFAVGTKLLYLKRPNLVPILDGLVAKLVLGHEVHNIEDAKQCCQTIRNIGRSNLRTIESAVRLLNERLPHGDAYRELSLVRALDAVLWFTEQRPRRRQYSGLFVHTLEPEGSGRRP